MKKEMGLVQVLVAVLSLTGLTSSALSHCDTLEGPVVTTARAALEKGDVTPVLKWVKAEDEASIRDAFQKTMTVRAKGSEAKSLADMYFFETLVRVHRAGEGAPYTGLKSTDPEPAVAGADHALQMGSVDDLVKLVSEDVAEGITSRFMHTLELKKHADESVEKGREFVASYVEFTHYVEALHAAASRAGGHHAEGGDVKSEEGELHTH